MNCKDPSSRLVRWRLKLAEYEYKINANADFLSRSINVTNFENFQNYHQQTLTVKYPSKDSLSKNKIKNLVIPLALDSNLHIDYLK